MRLEMRPKLSDLLTSAIVISVMATPCLATPHTLISCRDISAYIDESNRGSIAREHQGVREVISSIHTSRWMPRSPQLRGRVNQDQRDDEPTSWSGRIGARLYLPAFTVDPPEVRALSISLSELPRAWLTARQRRERSQVIETHLLAREAWVSFRSAQESAEIERRRAQISTSLERAGALPSRSARRTALREALAHESLARAESRWVGASSLVYQITHSQRGAQQRDSASASHPLKSACLSRPTDQKSWDQLKRRARALTVSEAEILLEINQRGTDQARRSGRWFDFIELSYDQRGRDVRWIAEVGVDLIPLDPRDAEESLKLHQLRAELRERGDEAGRVESSLLAQLELMRELALPPLEITRPKLDKLIDLELYELEVKLWESRWLRYLSSERTLAQWILTRRELSTQPSL